MMRWLVVGLGAMGAAFARRLATCGHAVVGVDPSGVARADLDDVDGVTTVPSLDHVDTVDVASVVVRTPAQVEQVMAQLAAGTWSTRPLPVLVSSTIDPATARGLATWDGEVLRVVEAPVTGLVSGALEGSLTVMVAGHVLAEDQRLLRETLAGTLVVLDDYGQPNLAKLLNNCLLAYNAHALAAMLELGRDEGLAAPHLMEVLADGSGGSFAASRLATLVPDLIDKDVGLLAGSVGALPTVRPDADPVTPAVERARHLAAGGD